MATRLLRTKWGMALNVYFRRKKSFSFVNFLKNLHFMRRLSREVIFLLNSENPWVSTPQAAPKYTHMNSTTYWSHGQHDFAHNTIGFFLFPLFHLLPSITDLCLCRRECQHTWKLLVRVGGRGRGRVVGGAKQSVRSVCYHIAQISGPLHPSSIIPRLGTWWTIAVSPLSPPFS